jgi:hypothetical protein
VADSPYDRLAARLVALAGGVARSASPPVSRGIVTKSDPLTVEVDEGLTLEEGDDDVEIARGVLADRPAPGVTVALHQDGEGDWVIGDVIE